MNGLNLIFKASPTILHIWAKKKTEKTKTKTNKKEKGDAYQTKTYASVIIKVLELKQNNRDVYLYCSRAELHTLSEIPNDGGAG